MTRIVIIGGGIVGISAAARLAPNADVTVLEAEDALAYHASGRSAALYEANYGKPTTVELSFASGDYYRDGGYLSPRGLMLVGSDAQADEFETSRQELNLQQITMEEARTLCPILDPDVVTLAAHHKEAWDIDTDRVIQDFARDARGHGARILTKSRVTDIRRVGDAWEIDAAETHHADIIVNAAGPWVDQIAQMAGVAPIGIQPYRRSMARIPAPGGHDVSGWPMLHGPGETSWYAKPDAGALIVSPADEDPMEPQDAWADDMILAEGLARYSEMVTEEVTRLLSNWAGLRSFSPDRQLVIGADPVVPGFFWSAGQGGYGFQTAPAASQLVADLIFDRPSPLRAGLVDFLNPKRFAK